MSTVAAAPARAATSRIGVAIFLATDAITFSALFAAYAVFRAKSPSWPQGAALYSLPIAALLTASSPRQRGRPPRGRANLRVEGRSSPPLDGGLRHALPRGPGLRVLPPRERRLHARRGIVPAVFYVLTGLHGLHVLAGVLLLAAAASKAPRGGGSGLLDGAALYWLFVDAVWVILLVFVYVF